MCWYSCCIQFHLRHKNKFLENNFHERAARWSVFWKRARIICFTSSAAKWTASGPLPIDQRLSMSLKPAPNKYLCSSNQTVGHPLETERRETESRFWTHEVCSWKIDCQMAWKYNQNKGISFLKYFFLASVKKKIGIFKFNNALNVFIFPFVHFTSSSCTSYSDVRDFHHNRYVAR